MIPIRMLLLGVHFVVASLLGLLVGMLRPFHPDNSRICARLYALPALRIMGLRVQLDTASLRERRASAVIVSNHLSNHDLFVFGRIVPPRCVTLGKKSLKWIPLFGQLYWLAGNVLVDRGNPASAKQAMLTLTDTLQHKNTSIWVFAEGTRSHGKGLAPLKKGAFVMAVNAGVPIIPVCASTYVTRMNLAAWHSGDAVLRSLAPIATAGLTLDDVPALMAQCEALMKDAIAQMDRQLS